jgi:hypothetical protein
MAKALGGKGKVALIDQPIVESAINVFLALKT